MSKQTRSQTTKHGEPVLSAPAIGGEDAAHMVTEPESDASGSPTLKEPTLELEPAASSGELNPQENSFARPEDAATASFCNRPEPSTLSTAQPALAGSSNAILDDTSTEDGRADALRTRSHYPCSPFGLPHNSAVPAGMTIAQPSTQSATSEIHVENADRLMQYRLQLQSSGLPIERMGALMLQYELLLNAQAKEEVLLPSPESTTSHGSDRRRAIPSDVHTSPQNAPAHAISVPASASERKSMRETVAPRPACKAVYAAGPTTHNFASRMSASSDNSAVTDARPSSGAKRATTLSARTADHAAHQSEFDASSTAEPAGYARSSGVQSYIEKDYSHTGLWEIATGTFDKTTENVNAHRAILQDTGFAPAAIINNLDFEELTNIFENDPSDGYTWHQHILAANGVPMHLVVNCTPAYAQFHFGQFYEKYLRTRTSLFGDTTILDDKNDMDAPVNLKAFKLAQHAASAATIQGPSANFTRSKDIVEGSYVTLMDDPTTIAKVEVVNNGYAFFAYLSNGALGKARLADLRCAPERPATTLSNDPNGRYMHVPSTGTNEQRSLYEQRRQRPVLVTSPQHHPPVAPPHTTTHTDVSPQLLLAPTYMDGRRQNRHSEAEHIPDLLLIRRRNRHSEAEHIPDLLLIRRRNRHSEAEHIQDLLLIRRRNRHSEAEHIPDLHFIQNLRDLAIHPASSENWRGHFRRNRKSRLDHFHSTS